jgi:phytoene desaturase
MRVGARIFELSRHTFLRKALGETPDLSALKALRHFPPCHAWGVYHRAVERYFKSPRLRQMYNRYPTYVGSSPYQTPATLLLIPYIEQAFGGWYVRGGLYRIIESLKALADRLSVEVCLGARVSRILSDSVKKICGVELENGDRREADVVVMNGDASTTRALLAEDGAESMRLCDRSLSGFILLLGLRRRLPGQEHHTVYFSADYHREFEQLFTRRVFPDDPTIYVSMPSHADRSICPPDGEALFIMANAPADDGGLWDEAATRRARQRVLERLRKGGLPLLEDDIVACGIWTPDRLARTYNMPGGAIYGMNSHGWRNAFLRPPNRDRRYKGLYHVGGSAHPGGGTPTVLMSARITTELIEKHETDR